MGTVFTINFRREAFLREQARSRARVIALGVWLSYFGVLVVIFGLYGLNCATIAQRTRIVERQARVQRELRTNQVDWSRQSGELAMIERGVADPIRWRERLERIAVALPANAKLQFIEFNPNSATGGGEGNRLLLTGSLRARPEEDRMRAVTGVVTALQGDSVLSREFRSIRLASTSIAETNGSGAEFVIECRP